MILYFKKVGTKRSKVITRETPVGGTLEGIVSDVCFVKEIWRCCAMTRLVATETSNQYLDKYVDPFSRFIIIDFFMNASSFILFHNPCRRRHADGKYKQFRMARKRLKKWAVYFFCLNQCYKLDVAAFEIGVMILRWHSTWIFFCPRIPFGFSILKWK